MEERMDIDDGDMRPVRSEYPEPFGNSAAFPWMGQYQAVPVESFPTSHGAIIHEGFIPDDEELLPNGLLGNGIDEAARMYDDLSTTNLADRFADPNGFRSLDETPPRFVGLRGPGDDESSNYSDEDDGSLLSDDDDRR